MHVNLYGGIRHQMEGIQIISCIRFFLCLSVRVLDKIWFTEHRLKCLDMAFTVGRCGIYCRNQNKHVICITWNVHLNSTPYENK